MNINFSKQYVLENDFVKLRPLTIQDFEILKPFVSERNLWKFSSLPMYNEDDMEAYIKNALKSREENREYPFIVFDKKLNKYVGCTRFYDMQITFNTLQLGYTWYATISQGTAVNKNCKFLLFQFAFEELGVERVEFRAHAKNERSISAMKSIGCTIEGILRNHMPVGDGTRRDTIVLSVLKNEWFSSVKENLINKIACSLKE